ncbi:hypothetical protein IAT40_003660 [Kwoniella sp. CBS 6097]
MPMPKSSTPVTLVGATGLTGSRILAAILSSTHPFDLTVLARRPLPSSFLPTTGSLSLNASSSSDPSPRVSSDPTSSSSHHPNTRTGYGNPLTRLTTRIYMNLFDAAAVPQLPAQSQDRAPAERTGAGHGGKGTGEADNAIARPGGVYVSCLASNVATGGTKAEREKTDLVLNEALAKQAKRDGAETMILVTAAGANPNSYFFFSRIKGQLEESIRIMGFKHVIILRPGAILGERTKYSFAELPLQRTLRGIRSLGINTSSLCVDAEDIGACIAYLSVNPPEAEHTILWNSDTISYAEKYRQTMSSSQPSFT